MFNIRFIWAKLKGKRMPVIVGFILTIVTSIIGIVNPYLSKFLIDDVIKKKNTQLLIPLVLVMSAIVLVKTLIHLFKIYCMEISSQHLLYNIRTTIFKNMQYQEMSYFDRVSTGDIITRLNGDLEFVRHFTAYSSYSFIESIFNFICAVGILLFISVKLTLALLAVLPLIIGISYYYSKFVRPFFKENRKNLARLNTAAQENIEGNRVVKAFAREDYEVEKFGVFSKEYMISQLKATYAFQKIVPVMNFLAHSLTFINLLVGGILVINGEITLGELTVFTSLTWALSGSMQNITALINDYQRFSASVEKVIEICCDRPLISTRQDAVAQRNILGNIEFKNVSFSFDENKILNDISFKINAGETVAIMGPTGSGKTTIINLISRFYDADSGDILLDDVDIKLRRLEDIHKSVAIATQDVFLFSDTIDSNIAFANAKMSEDEVRHYARLSASDDFISNLSEGYDTIIGERGVGLSGGQRQRLALARALASRPSILVLDDTTSAVDLETEKYIQNSLENLPFNCTKILIVQRISSVINADKIFILQNGKITIGNHTSLSQFCKYYREICELQDVADLPKFKGGV